MFHAFSINSVSNIVSHWKLNTDDSKTAVGLVGGIVPNSHFSKYTVVVSDGVVSHHMGPTGTYSELVNNFMDRTINSFFSGTEHYTVFDLNSKRYVGYSGTVDKKSSIVLHDTPVVNTLYDTVSDAEFFKDWLESYGNTLNLVIKRVGDND